MTLPERQASSRTNGIAATMTQAIGAAMAKMSATKRKTNGRSTAVIAVEPQNTLRTVSMSRNRMFQ